MITVQFERREDGVYALTASGHAGAGPRGGDPVCAAVTALCYTLAQALQLQREKLRESPQIQIREGYARIEAQPAREGAGEIGHTFRVVCAGLAMLAHNYPAYIQWKGNWSL